MPRVNPAGYRKSYSVVVDGHLRDKQIVGAVGKA
jgi:hypothetical protein